MVLNDTDTSHGPHEFILFPIAETNPLTQEITANNASSDLLRLPQEIKQLIYETILGGHLIHVCRDPKRPGYSFTHCLCQAKHSEKEAERIFAASKEPWFSIDVASRHKVCYPPSIRNHPCLQCWRQNDITTESYAQLSLGVLRCCRQMYQEARPIIFSNSTFSLMDFSDFRLFYYSTGMSDIRSLHLDIIIHSNFEETMWNKTLERFARDMRSLQHIYINIDPYPEDGQQISRWKFKEPAECSFLEGLRSLIHLKLKTATVIISGNHLSDCPLRSQENGAERWTMLEKQEWAGYTKRVLLHQEEEQQPTMGEVM